MPVRDRYHDCVRNALIKDGGYHPMDGLDAFRQIIRRILRECAEIPYSHGEINLECVFDIESDRYLLMLVGRDGHRRIHGCLVHVDIVDGNIWIQRDGTEHGIARDLLAAGVPADKIILALRASPPVSAASVA